VLKHYYLLFLFLILTTSCSTKLYDYFRDDPDTSKHNNKLMKQFDVDEDVLEKFSQKKVDEPQPKKEDVEPSNAIVSSKKTPVPAKKVTPKKQVSHQKTVITKKDIPVEKEALKERPEDYPPAYIESDKKAAEFWSSFNPIIIPDEEVYMDINYMGMSTGKIAITTKGKSVIGEDEVYHLNAKLKTAKYYRYLYELDDNIDSYVTVKNFLPVKFSLIQRESGQNIDDLQLFDQKEGKAYSFYQRETKKGVRKSKSVEYLPDYFQDPLSVIFFIRGLPMREGAVFEVPVMNRGRILIMHLKVEKSETIKTKIGEKEAYKIIATSDYSGKTLKSGDMHFWFSKDDRKIFLKFFAKISIGAISGDIEKYTH
jgi:hypothetical protein